MTTTAKRIDADVTAALDRWAAAIGTPEHQAASEALDELLVELCAARPRPAGAEYTVPEATDMLALFRLAAMDGYNKKPLSTVDEWAEECKKRMFLLYLAGRRDGPEARTEQRLRDALESIVAIQNDPDDDRPYRYAKALGIAESALAAGDTP